MADQYPPDGAAYADAAARQASSDAARVARAMRRLAEAIDRSTMIPEVKLAAHAALAELDGRRPGEQPLGRN